MNNRGVFIAVEGPIGVGKTTLANILKPTFWLYSFKRNRRGKSFFIKILYRY